MTDHLRLAASYLGIGSLLCQLTLLVMQLRTYRRTGHSSLLILAVATALAILYLGSGFAAALYASRASVLWRLYLGLDILFVLQAVFAIWGAASLFRAFAARYARSNLEIDGSAVPGPLMVGAEQELRAGLTDAASELGRAGAFARLCRLWTLRRVDNITALATERSVALLGALSLALWTSIDRLQSESSEHITPSEPQAYFGADIDRMLSQQHMGQPGITQN